MATPRLTEQIRFRVTPEDFHTIRADAQREGRTVAGFIRHRLAAEHAQEHVVLRLPEGVRLARDETGAAA
jgi:hypothetical protein